MISGTWEVDAEAGVDWADIRKQRQYGAAESIRRVHGMPMRGAKTHFIGGSWASADGVRCSIGKTPGLGAKALLISRTCHRAPPFGLIPSVLLNPDSSDIATP